MKKIFLYFAALTAIAVACRKVDIEPQEEVDPEPEVEMVTETITASRDVSTKVTIDNTSGAFAWTATNDLVAVHVNTGEYVTSAGASTSAKSATFDVTYPAGATRDAFAVFPSIIVAADAANYGQSGSPLDVTLPSSYTLAQVSGETSPCPMIATNDPSSSEWSFKQLCGLLRLTVNGIPADATGLVIQFPGKKVNGAFSITSPVTPETSCIETGAPADGEDKITVTFDAGITTAVLNIPLPTGDYEDVYITSVGSSKKVATLRTIKAGGYTAARARAKKLTVTVASISVSASKQVMFAPGNLQYLGNANGTGTWRFADHQYDFMGDGPTSGTNYQGNVTVAGYTKYNASADLDVARDLFSWGTSGFNDKYPYMTSTNSDSYYRNSMVGEGANYDWGVYHSALGSSTDKITNGGNYSWRLWTSEEMSYVMSRSNNVHTKGSRLVKKLYCAATLSGITTNDLKGVIIFPDGWTGEPIKTIKYEAESGYDTNVLDADQWAMLEGLGCVFLPAAHVRNGTDVTYLKEGHYWTSTSIAFGSEMRGGALEIYSSGNVVSGATNKCLRKFGQSVRLIREL